MKTYTLVSDSITTNLYSLKDIYEKNLQTLIDLNSSAASIDHTWLQRQNIQDDILEQSNKLDDIIEKISLAENLNFRFGS